MARLVAALQRLVHRLDLVAAADCVIDLGPEGGEKGGTVVAWGTPERVARSQASRTAPYLWAHLSRASPRRRPT